MEQAHAPWHEAPPKRILLATDLSSRCDRALDRAVQLAEQWGASLQVLHVLEEHGDSEVPTWRRDRSAETLAREEIEADLRGRGVPWELSLETGDPATAILHHAAESGCGLIVTGVARGEPLGRSTVGQIVEGLARQAPVPLLVVRSRSRGAYARVVVATDFSNPSRHALDCAAALFPEVELTLLHAFRVPFEGFLDKQANMLPFREAAEKECAAFLGQPGRGSDAASRAKILLEYGSPEALTAAYVRDSRTDLVVVGTQGRTGLAGFLVGSTAKRLLACLPCDVMMVRAPRISSDA